MATYKSNTYDGRYLQLTITETTDAKTNKSTLNWKLESIGGSSSYYTIAATTVQINGITVYSKAQTSWSTQTFPAAKGSTSGSITVDHNTDGSKSVTVVFKTRVYYSDAVDYGGTLALTKIDRTAPTVTLSTSDIAASGVKLSVTASTTCDRWDYSTDNGSNWTNFSATSGTSAITTISGLSPNTEYNIKVRARKSSNEVYGTSAAATIKTLGGSILSAVDTFTVDESTAKLTLSVTVYNESYIHTLIVNDGSTTILTITDLDLADGTNAITLTASQAQPCLRLCQVKKTTQAHSY